MVRNFRDLQRSNEAQSLDSMSPETGDLRIVAHLVKFRKNDRQTNRTAKRMPYCPIPG